MHACMRSCIKSCAEVVFLQASERILEELLLAAGSGGDFQQLSGSNREFEDFYASLKE